MALTSPRSEGPEALRVLRTPPRAPAARIADGQEPEDGRQTGGDLVVKNVLIFGSAGIVLALAAWLLV